MNNPAREVVNRIIYAFGSPCNGQYGHLVLSQNHQILGYTHFNESSWVLDNDELCFLDANNNISSRFHHIGDKIWIGKATNKVWPLYLVPALELNDSSTSTHASIYVNSIPKSGTYFLEKALANLGYSKSRLHLSGTSTVHDYRRLSDENIHTDPQSVFLELPVELVTTLSQGQIFVGHIEHANIIEKIRHNNTHIISVVRNLRDVLISLYKFKLTRVKPVTQSDEAWRTISEPSRFTAFFIHFIEKDIKHIAKVARLIIDNKIDPMLRYEDMCKGFIPHEQIEKLEIISLNFGSRLCTALSQEFAKPTPTYSGEITTWKNYWNDDIESLFQKCGLAEINYELGYE